MRPQELLPGAGKTGPDWRCAFERRFGEDPISAVHGLTRDVLRQDVPAAEAAGLLLPYLVKASYAQRNLVFNALMDFAKPQDLLCAALAVQERGGDRRILGIVADLLEHYEAG
jgi:hypothetical protein